VASRRTGHPGVDWPQPRDDDGDDAGGL